MTTVLPAPPVLRLPTLDQLRETRPQLAVRLPIPDRCVCDGSGVECQRCFLDADAAYARREDR